MGLLLNVYLCGLFTFPALIVAICILAYRSAPIVNPDQVTARHVDVALHKKEDASFVKLQEGWLTARRTFLPLPKDAGYSAMLQSFMDARSKDPRRLKAKGEYYSILKQTPLSVVLYLYDCDPSTSDLAECLATADCGLFDVSIYPVDDKTRDGELWMKRNAIVLKPRGQDIYLGNNPLEGVTDSLDSSANLPWFIFPRTNDLKEDWYLLFLKACHPLCASISSMFDPTDIASLIENIDSTADDIPMRWFNALLGRLFLSVYKTQAVESWIVNRIVRKLARVSRPSYLSEIRVREVNVGKTSPLFGRPMLKELTTDGVASMEVGVRYKGDFRITISTVATINLGARFKSYEVALVLAVVLKEIEGTVLVKMKKPPSNRFWFGFTTMPKMTLSIEPVVSDRQIKYSVILNQIEAKIREVVAESIVVPHVDDISFFETAGLSHRGGIFDDSARQHEELVNIDPSADTEEDAIQHEHEGEEVAESTLRHRQPTSLSEKDSDGMSPLSRTSTNDSTDSSKQQHGRKKSWFSSSKSLLSSSSHLSLNSNLLNDTTHVNSSSMQKKPSSESVRSTDVPNHKIERKMPPATHSTPSSSQKSSMSIPEEEDQSAASKLTKLLEKNELARKTSSGSNKGKERATSPTLAATHIQTAETPPTLHVDSPSLPVIEASVNLPSRRSTISSVSSDGLQLVDTPQSTSREVSPSRSNPSLLTTPARPAQFLPPPKRSPDIQRKPPPINPSPPAKESLLHTWKTKATDKEAIAQGYSQAKDAIMKKWGASTWAKAKNGDRVSGEEANEEIDNAVLGIGLPPASSSNTNTNRPSYRDYRAAKDQDQIRPRMPSISSGQANPSVAQSTTSLSTPSDAAFSYRAAPMMAIPGIADPSHRGGLGSQGPLELHPVRPGDVEEKPRMLPPSFNFNRNKIEEKTTVSSDTSVPVRKVPPPFFGSPTPSQNAFQQSENATKPDTASEVSIMSSNEDPVITLKATSDNSASGNAEVSLQPNAEMHNSQDAVSSKPQTAQEDPIAEKLKAEVTDETRTEDEAWGL